MKIILASASPRRRELLKQTGLEFEVVPARGEEIVTMSSPSEIAMELARQKAEEVSSHIEEGEEGVLIIGADTVVVYGDEILGKPKDEEDARRMLTALSGDTHHVYTGVCLIKRIDQKEEERTFYDETGVFFYPMSDAEISAYIDTKDPMDKAGAYGIQSGAGIYVRGIMGDYNNVVGLPLSMLYQELKEMGILPDG